MRFILVLMFLMSSVFAQDVYSIKEKSIDGKEYDLSTLKGKPTLIVNIASQCGYTPQLEKLEALYQKYKAKGLVVLGVPTNDFGGQTPEDDKGMQEFCSKTYNVTFPLLTKKTIKGSEKRELYKVLTEKSDKKGDVGWNFEKFLVNKKGVVVSRFGSKVDPMDAEITKAVENELK